jgi:hypothetical protein
MTFALNKKRRTPVITKLSRAIFVVAALVSAILSSGAADNW